MGISMKTTSGKLLASAALVATAAGVAGLGTYGAFTSSTAADQQVTAGTVKGALVTSTAATPSAVAWTSTVSTPPASSALITWRADVSPVRVSVPSVSELTKVVPPVAAPPARRPRHRSRGARGAGGRTAGGRAVLAAELSAARVRATYPLVVDLLELKVG
mgnify:CR=1 FL=1